MITRFSLRRLLIGGLTAFALIGGGISVPLVAASLTPAMAQSADEMQEALENYGHWVRHARYGEVWVPDGVPPDWRPYEYGHWVYTDDWGWYWISDESEDDWGWVVYHYGRWGFDREIGWFWVRGDDWAPAWVDWRYGGDEVGWAPLPPDDAIDVYEEQPEFWAFVPLRYMGEERLRTHYYPRDRRIALLRSTRIVNRPVHVEGRRIWVNPGLAPGFIAGRTHVALHAYQVRPRVFSRTTSVQGAVTVRKEDLRIKGAVKRSAPITVQRTTVAIQPTAGAPAPQPLNKKEPGRLGPHVPRAAQGTTVSAARRRAAATAGWTAAASEAIADPAAAPGNVDAAAQAPRPAAAGATTSPAAGSATAAAGAAATASRAWCHRLRHRLTCAPPKPPAGAAPPQAAAAAAATAAAYRRRRRMRLRRQPRTSSRRRTAAPPPPAAGTGAAAATSAGGRTAGKARARGGTEEAGRTAGSAQRTGGLAGPPVHICRCLEALSAPARS